MTTKSNKCIFSTLREPPLNKKDLQALTLVGPPWDHPESDPLAALHFDNRLYICGQHCLYFLTPLTAALRRKCWTNLVKDANK